MVENEASFQEKAGELSFEPPLRFGTLNLCSRGKGDEKRKDHPQGGQPGQGRQATDGNSRWII
jgi:hypothetical protein